MALRRRTFARQLLAASVAAAGSVVFEGTARAAEVTASAKLDTTTTRVGEGVRLSLTVRSSGSDRAIRPAVPAAVEGNFEVASSSSSRNFSFGFGGGAGGGASEHTTTMLLIPLRAGEFDLGFSVIVDGETIESDIPRLTVLEADAPAVEELTPGSVPTEAHGDIFLWATTDKATAYVGEQITYMLDVYERRQYLNVHLRKPPSFSDFFSEELPQGEAEVKRVGDVPYRVEPGIRRALFPQRAGTLQIGSAEISVGLRQRLQSPELSVEVLPLPAQGQPANFSPNNVGRYAIEATVDRAELDPGEPFTLTVTIEGTGNIQFFDPGTWANVDGVRRYEPKVDTRMRSGAQIGGTRRYEFLMIPESPGSLTIPPHTVGYFDPELQAYAEAASPAIQIEVKGTPDPSAASGLPAPTYDETESEVALAPIVGGDTVPEDEPRSRWLTTSRWAYGMLAVPALAAIGLGGAALVRRFGPDDRARARGREKLRRQLRIKAAEEAIESGEGFHGTLSKLLHELAVRRAGVDGVGLPRPELMRLLLTRGAKSEDIDALRALLDQCDAARFAALGGSAPDRRALLDEALVLVRRSSLSKEGP